jgi:hypothetical protein
MMMDNGRKVKVYIDLSYISSYLFSFEICVEWMKYAICCSQPGGQAGEVSYLSVPLYSQRTLVNIRILRQFETRALEKIGT